MTNEEAYKLVQWLATGLKTYGAFNAGDYRWKYVDALTIAANVLRGEIVESVVNGSEDND